MATPTITSARPPYRKRDVPRAYEHGWFAIELGNIQRAYVAATVKRVNTFYTITARDRLVECDCTAAAVVIGLPAANREMSLEVHIKKVAGAFPVTIAGTVDETVDPVLTNLWDSITIMSDGERWLKISSVP